MFQEVALLLDFLLSLSIIGTTSCLDYLQTTQAIHYWKVHDEQVVWDGGDVGPDS